MSTIHEIDVAVDDDDSGAAALSSSNHNRKRSASQAGLLNSPATPRKKMKGDHRIAKFKFSPTPKKMKPVETSREAVSNELQAYLIEDFEGDMGSFFLNPEIQNGNDARDFVADLRWKIIKPLHARWVMQVFYELDADCMSTGWNKLGLTSWNPPEATEANDGNHNRS